MTLCGIIDLFRRVTGIGGGIPPREDVPEFQEAREATDRLRLRASLIVERFIGADRQS
jgi:hypothetical protein